MRNESLRTQAPGILLRFAGLHDDYNAIVPGHITWVNDYLMSCQVAQVISEKELDYFNKYNMYLGGSLELLYVTVVFW